MKVLEVYVESISLSIPKCCRLVFQNKTKSSISNLSLSPIISPRAIQVPFAIVRDGKEWLVVSLVTVENEIENEIGTRTIEISPDKKPVKMTLDFTVGNGDKMNASVVISYRLLTISTIDTIATSSCGGWNVCCSFLGKFSGDMEMKIKFRDEHGSLLGAGRLSCKVPSIFLSMDTEKTLKCSDIILQDSKGNHMISFPLKESGPTVFSQSISNMSTIIFVIQPYNSQNKLPMMIHDITISDYSNKSFDEFRLLAYLQDSLDMNVVLSKDIEDSVYSEGVCPRPLLPGPKVGSFAHVGVLTVAEEKTKSMPISFSRKLQQLHKGFLAIDSSYGKASTPLSLKVNILGINVEHVSSNATLISSPNKSITYPVIESAFEKHSIASGNVIEISRDDSSHDGIVLITLKGDLFLIPHPFLPLPSAWMNDQTCSVTIVVSLVPYIPNYHAIKADEAYGSSKMIDEKHQRRASLASDKSMESIDMLSPSDSTQELQGDSSFHIPLEDIVTDTYASCPIKPFLALSTDDNKEVKSMSPSLTTVSVDPVDSSANVVTENIDITTPTKTKIELECIDSEPIAKLETIQANRDDAQKDDKAMVGSTAAPSNDASSISIIPTNNIDAEIPPTKTEFVSLAQESMLSMEPNQASNAVKRESDLSKLDVSGPLGTMLQIITRDLKEKQDLINKMHKEIVMKSDAINECGEEIRSYRNQVAQLQARLREAEKIIEEKAKTQEENVNLAMKALKSRMEDVQGLSKKALIDVIVEISRRYQLLQKGFEETKKLVVEGEVARREMKNHQKTMKAMKEATVKQSQFISQLQEELQKVEAMKSTILFQENVIVKLQSFMESKLHQRMRPRLHNHDSDDGSGIFDHNASNGTNQIEDKSKNNGFSNKEEPNKPAAIQALQHIQNNEELVLLRNKIQDLEERLQFYEDESSENNNRDYRKVAHQLEAEISVKDIRIAALEKRLESSTQESSREIARLRSKLFEVGLSLANQSDDHPEDLKNWDMDMFSLDENFAPLEMEEWMKDLEKSNFLSFNPDIFDTAPSHSRDDIPSSIASGLGRNAANALRSPSELK